MYKYWVQTTVGEDEGKTSASGALRAIKTTSTVPAKSRENREAKREEEVAV